MEIDFIGIASYAVVEEMKELGMRASTLKM
jgi:hypothetical protein